MRALAGVVGAALVLLMLAEVFVTFLLPRRVRRDPKLARRFVRALWIAWRGTARLLPEATADTFLGFFGPAALIMELFLWAGGIVVGYTLLNWAFASQTTLGEDVYFSGGEFLSAGPAPGFGNAARVLGLLEAATGLGVVFVVIGYLPSVYGAYSRREIAVSQLSPRAGSPATAAGLLRRVGRLGPEELDRWLRDAEEWTAELMETQLSFPLLAWYRSQHLNQSWLAALTVIVDAAAVVIASRADDAEGQAELTYAIGRHALADIALQFRLRGEGTHDRLTDEQLHELRHALEGCGSPRDADAMRRRLDHLRAGYEANAVALGQLLALRVPSFA